MNASVRRLLVHVIGLFLAVGWANGQSTLPDPRWGQAATVFGTTVVVHGGKTDPNHEYSYSSAPNTPQLMSLDLASSFNLDSPPWQTLSATSSPALAFHTITAYSQTEFLFFGGDPGPSYPLSTRNDSAGSMWFNGNSATWTTHPENWANEPLRREFHSATSWYNKVFITGGEKADGSGLAFKEPYQYDSGSSQFTQLSSDNGPPDLIGHASLTLSNGTLLVLGGYSNSLSQLQPLSTIYTFNISSNTWSSFNASGGTVPDGRRNFAAVMLGDSQFLIQGGADGSLANGLSDGFIFDLNAKTWTNVTALEGVGARWDHTVFAAGSQVFFAFGYTSAGAASNQLLLFDTTSSQFISQFTPASTMAWANINSPIIYPVPSWGGGGNGGGGNSGGNTGSSGSDQGGSNSTDGNPSTHSSTPTPQQAKQSSTPIILGSLFGGLAAAAAVIFIVIFYRRRRRTHRRGWSGNTEESEKAVMVGGFQPVPHSRTYGLMTRVLHIPIHTQYSQAPRRERFDILADDDNTEYEYGAMGTRPGNRRKGTSGSGSTYFGAGRWNSRGGGQSAIGSLVNASVSSFRSALGFGVVQNNIARSPSREGKRESSFPGMGASTKNLIAPPSAWRRGSSYGSNYPGDSYTAGDRGDPFGDEHGVRPISEYGVEEEYQKAMMMQHEMLRRASSSGPEEYSALILNRRTSESGTPVGERPPSLVLNRRASDGPSMADSNPLDLAGYIRGGIPLEPVVSISDPSTSHAHSEDTHAHSEDLHDTSAISHGTSLRTPEDRYIPRVYSPNSFQYHQLQRNTSGGSRIGVSLTRTMSAISSLFGGGSENHGGVSRRETRRRRGSYSKSPGGGFLGGGGSYVTAEYTDIRDPNPPPPELGAKLISIEEGGESRQASGSNEAEAPPAPGKSQSDLPPRHAQYPSLVLKPLHEKSLSSLRTANSEALERLGTGNWDVVQRVGTSSSRQTNATDTTDESGYTHLGGEGELGWRDVVGRKAEDPSAIVESPVDLEARERTTRFGQPLSIPQPLSPTSPTANTSTSPGGPRPIPPPKRVTQNLAQRIEALGMSKEVSPTSPTKPPSDAGKRTPAVYGLAPKPTLFIANPSARGTSDST